MENEDASTQLSKTEKSKTRKERSRKKLRQLLLNIVAKPEAWSRHKFRLFCQEELAHGTSFISLDNSALFVG